MVRPPDDAETQGQTPSDMSLSGLPTMEPLPDVSLSLPPGKLRPMDRIRFYIALILVIAFFLLISIPVVVWGVAILSPVDALGIEDAIRMLTAISASMSGLVGAVVGYYFGQSTSESVDS